MFSVEREYILIFITLLKDANIIDDINARMLAFIFENFSSLNNSFKIKYIKIVINKYIIIFKIIPGQIEKCPVVNPMQILRNK